MLAWSEQFVFECLQDYAMVFGTSPRLSKIDSFTISVNCTPIRPVSHFKCLGVVFDERHSWNVHVKFILAKADKIGWNAWPYSLLHYLA